MQDHPTTQRGSVVLVALCLTIVLGVIVVGYVAVCARTMELSNRSFCTISSVQLAEAGMDEALWSLNQALTNPAYNWSGWDAPTTNSGVSSITKTLTGFLTNNGIQGRVNIRIDNYNIDQGTNPPQSYTLPLTITVDGISLMPDGITIDKQLVTTVKPAALFSNAVGAVDLTLNPSVSFANASGGIVDSYNSTPTAPNNGIYTPDPSIVNRSDSAIISGAHLTIKNAVILGYATTANSSNDTPFIDINGSVTSIDTTTGHPSSVRIDNNRISNNANQYVFDIVAPTGAGTTVTGGNTIVTLSPLGFSGASAPSIYYVTGDLTLSGSDILTINGPVIIGVSGNLTIQDNAQIVVTYNANPDLAGSAQIYVAGQTISIGGQGIDNQTQRPRKLTIFHDRTPSTSGQMTIDSVHDFYGAIYAPNSPLVVNSDLTVYGALVGQSVTFNGTPTIHYDLDLRKATFSVVNTPYDVSQWIVSN